jgi:hypothetical protein
MGQTKYNTMTTNKFTHAGLDWHPHTPGDIEQAKHELRKELE